jgi:hypothetical protein
MRRYAIFSAFMVGFVVLAGAGQAAAVPRSPDSADGYSSLSALSCGSPGNCSAGGYYTNPAGDASQVFVVNEKSGRWGKAAELPGLAALNRAKSDELLAMSCPSPGNCSAIGFYSIGVYYNRRSFVAGEKNGRWGKAQVIPGTQKLEVAGIGSAFMSISCSSAGNCGAYGTYPSSSVARSYVVSQARGVWAKAVKLPGITLDTVSCAAAGNCVAGGHSSTHAVTVSEAGGRWGKPQDLPGVPTDISGPPTVTSVSCSSAGNCTAGGDYISKDASQVFVATESKGTWKKASELPGIVALNVGGGSALFTLSCASPGNCSAGGTYVSAQEVFEAFVASELGGRWGKAQEVPGTAKLNSAPGDYAAAQVNVLSCRSPGYCSAGGYYNTQNGQQAFIDTEAHGTWGTAAEVPGTGALNSGGSADLVALSCAHAGDCGAGGFYADSERHGHAFVISQAKGTWGRAQIIPGLAALSIRG